MKKTVAFLLFWFMALSGISQTIIHTKDGRSINVPVRQDEISSIEFTNAPKTPDFVVTPKETANPYLGIWARKEGSAVVEYMEITRAGQGIEFLFRESANGPAYGKGTGQVQNGILNGKSSNRVIRMKINNQNQIDYTSSDVDGNNPWSSVYFRVN